MQKLTGQLPINEQPAELSRFVVRTTAQVLGRGPTKARAFMAGDVICVVMRDT